MLSDVCRWLFFVLSGGIMSCLVIVLSFDL